MPLVHKATEYISHGKVEVCGNLQISKVSDTCTSFSVSRFGPAPRCLEAGVSQIHGIISLLIFLRSAVHRDAELFPPPRLDRFGTGFLVAGRVPYHLGGNGIPVEVTPLGFCEGAQPINRGYQVMHVGK